MPHPLTKLQEELTVHIAREDAENASRERRWAEFIRANERQNSAQNKSIGELTGAVKDLTKSVGELKESTDGLVASWRVLQGLRRFALWCAGFSGFGGLILWAWQTGLSGFAEMIRTLKN